jgi:sugar/nucleoside kinase (ribokinase family)
MYDILTFGDLCVDLILSGGDIVPEFGQVEKLVGEYTLEMGGSCSIFACQAARLGLKVAIMGRVGRDAFGELILARMTEAGVDTQFVETDPSLKTGLGIALCKEDDRAILTYPGTITAVQPADVTDKLLSLARHLHHGSYFLQTPLRPHIPDIFTRARQLGLTISLDTNWDPEDRWDGVAELLPLIDVFLPNETEAQRIAKNETGNAMRDLHKLGAPLVVLKRGSAGADVSDGRQLISQAVEPVSGGDSVGAGDSFDAGFLAGWLRGLSLEESLRIGCACGRSVAAQVGGVAGQPRWEDIKS